MAMTKYAVEKREVECGKTKVMLLANGNAMVKTAEKTFDARYQEEGERLSFDEPLPDRVMNDLLSGGYTVSDHK